MIDPIDGTANFVRGIPAWTVVIAGVRHGVCEVAVIHEPCTAETFHASRGGGAFLNDRPMRATSASSLGDGSVGTGFSNRREARNIVPFIENLIARGGVFYRSASGALMLAYVASGRLLGYVEEHMNAWDCLAGLLLVEEAGGRILAPDASTVLDVGTVVIAGGTNVFAEIESMAAQAFGAGAEAR